MSRYGISYYGLSYYGSDTTLKYDATPFTAIPSKQGEILLNWTDPTGDWSELVIVRNRYGFPVDPWDGEEIVKAYKGSDPVFYSDNSGLLQGYFYYYSIFVYSTVQYQWINAGTSYALSVQDCGNTEKMYDYLPEIYKITQPYAASSDWANQSLYNFLSNFGFQLDYDQSLTNLLLDMYDTQKVSGALVPSLLNQFGHDYEPAIGLERNRVILRDSVTLTKEKGSLDGLKTYLKDFTGWGIPAPISGTPNPSINGVVVGHNMMLDYNDSSFEEGIGHWNSLDGTADIDQLDTYKITSISSTSGTATVVVGKHNYDVGNQVIIQGLPYPLFNSTTPVTLTAVNQTTGTLSFTTTSADFTSLTGYNTTTQSYGTLTPAPSPWVESTAPALFPNKTSGILALYNSSTSSQTITAYCGDDDAINKGVPVTAGTTYAFSIYASKGNYTARNVTAKIKWFNRFGVYISTTSGTAVSDNTATFAGTSRPYASAAAPTGAYYACPGVSIASVGGTASNEHHYFDAAQFEAASSPTSFDEARQIHVTLKANRINELINPRFVDINAPWTATGATTALLTDVYEPGGALRDELYSITSGSITSGVSTLTFSLPHEFKIGDVLIVTGVTGANASDSNGARTITATSLYDVSYTVSASDSSITSGSAYFAGNGMSITATSATVTLDSWDGSTNSELINIYYPQTSYTFSIYSQAVTAAETVSLNIKWYDSSYSLISTSTGNSFSVTTTDWARPYVTATAPSTAAYASVELAWSTTSGNVITVTKALFENAGLVLEYFDGSSGTRGSAGPGTYYDCLWEGNVLNGARSHYYKNRYATQVRLVTKALYDQLPMGSTAAVYLAQPGT